MYILEKNAIDRITKLLNLNIKDVRQDWELEIADLNRISEFIKYYLTELLNDEEKRALFALIISSLDDFLNDSGDGVRYKEDISTIMKNDHLILSDIFDYWVESNPDRFTVGEWLLKLK